MRMHVNEIINSMCRLWNYSKIVTFAFEYPQKWDRSREPYYPVNNCKYWMLYSKYVELSHQKALVAVYISIVTIIWIKQLWQH